MPVTALVGTEPPRSRSLRSVLSAAKREFERGNWARGLVVLSLLLLVRTGAVVDLMGQAIAAVRSDPSSRG